MELAHTAKSSAVNALALKYRNPATLPVNGRLGELLLRMPIVMASVVVPGVPLFATAVPLAAPLMYCRRNDPS